MIKHKQLYRFNIKFNNFLLLFNSSFVRQVQLSKPNTSIDSKGLKEASGMIQIP